MDLRATCGDCGRRRVLDRIAWCRECDRLVCLACRHANHAHVDGAPAVRAERRARFGRGRVRCPACGAGVERTKLLGHLDAAHRRLVRG